MVDWTNPRTWLAGEKDTAALRNTHLRDNLLFLFMGQVCSIYQTVAQSIPNAASTKLTMDATEVDTGTMAELVNNQIGIDVAGLYLMVGVVAAFPNATGYRRAQIGLNGIQIPPGDPRDANATAGLPTVPMAFTVRSLIVGDKISLWTFQSSGAALNTNVASPYRSQLWVAQIGST